MHGSHVHPSQSAGSLAGILNCLLESFLDALKVCVKVKGASFFEGHLGLDSGKGCRDAAAGDGLNEGSPDIGTEEGCSNVGITDVQEGRREGLEVVGLLGREVDNLFIRVWLVLDNKAYPIRQK